MSPSWSGQAQSGSRDYDDADVARVLKSLPHGRQEAMSQQTFCNILRMEARKVRAILADLDGERFILAYSDGLLWDTEIFEETIGHTAKLRGTAQSELERVARRERFAATLNRRQAEMAL